MIELKTFGLFVVAFITIWLVAFIVELTWKRRKMPPGPFPLPILGNFLQMYSEGLVPWLEKMGEKYGPVYTVYWGSRPTVVLTGYQAVKEALVDQGDVFLGRGRLPVFERLVDNSGLSLSNGESWKQLKQFSLLTLKEFGMGRKKLEEPIQREAHLLVDHFRRSNGQPMDPSTSLMCASSNVMTSILLNTRFDFNDEKWMKILHEIQEGFTVISSIWGQLYDIFPNIMRFLPGPHKRIFELLKGTEDILKQRVKYNMETLDPSSPRDYTDCFLIRMEQEKKNPKTSFTMKNLTATVLDMFIGGAESTATTIRFGILVLIKYPDIQESLHKEIDQVIGQIREPVMEDRSKMHYMNAVIHEIQRVCDVFPLGFQRCPTKDAVFRGYNIPKLSNKFDNITRGSIVLFHLFLRETTETGQSLVTLFEQAGCSHNHLSRIVIGTDVLPVLTTVLRDQSQFETPGEINVNHFLDENGKFKKNNGFLPFSAGKRSCIGESLVRMELFLFFTTILQKFILKPTVNPKDLNISPVECGAEKIPPIHKVIFIPRE